jgi:hypothetical protein
MLENIFFANKFFIFVKSLKKIRGVKDLKYENKNR